VGLEEILFLYIFSVANLTLMYKNTNPTNVMEFLAEKFIAIKIGTKLAIKESMCSE
jgi:hypothetical protein